MLQKDIKWILCPACKCKTHIRIRGDTIIGILQYTKPLFSIPTHQYFFYPGNIAPKPFMETVQLEQSEYGLIRYPDRGSCLYRCGNERYYLQVIAPPYKAKLFGKAGGR